MIIQTQAIALQIRPWSRTSHMVTWLTPDHGKIVTPIKGACRPKSAFLGQYDLFYTCDLLFYRREHDGVHAIRECSPVALREPLRRNWRAAAAAAYLADLTARVTVGHQDAAPLFALLTRTLDRLADTRLESPLELILWYETHLLRHLGLLPDFTTCPHCHVPERPWLRFSLPSGRFLCQHLAQSQPGEATLSIHRDVQTLFRALCRAVQPPPGEQVAPDFASKKNHAKPNLILGLSRFLGMFIAFHLDVPSAVRRVTCEMLDTTPTQKPALLENS
jgi:DNA repair protein RecO